MLVARQKKLNNPPPKKTKKNPTMLSYYRYQEHEWVGVRGWHQRET